MRLQRTIQLLILAAGLLALSGCATNPISKNLRRQAAPLTLAQVAANPSAYTGATVIWGGQIINTVNSTNGGSIYVLKLPLHHDDARPKRYGFSPGRFIARTRGFLDPQIFKNGRLITVAGTIVGVETQPLQKMQYSYPVVGIEELHIWRRRPQYYYYPGWYGPGWGWYGPGWGWGWGVGWGWGPGWDEDWD